ncbi:MAG TPA: hypothetical protein OIM28_02160 [Clostridiaceae bacterium]|nr:hypothetical protein [Clostridiaceae bacterium]
MKDLLKRAGFTSILSSLVFLLLGILLVVNPDAMVSSSFLCNWCITYCYWNC